jgi:hypothetical protein
MSLNPNQIPKYAITPKTSLATLNAATAGALGANTNAQTAFTASASGSRVYSLIASTDDTAAVNLFVQIDVGGAGTTIAPVAQVNVPLSSGNIASTLAVDCLSPSVAVGLPIDNTGKRYIELAANDKLIVSTVANMTALKKCYVTAQAADYQ